MFELFRDLPEAIENNVNLPFRCSYRTTTSKPMLPNIKKTNENTQMNKKDLLDNSEKSKKNFNKRENKSFKMDRSFLKDD